MTRIRNAYAGTCCDCNEYVRPDEGSIQRVTLFMRKAAAPKLLPNFLVRCEACSDAHEAAAGFE